MPCRWAAIRGSTCPLQHGGALPSHPQSTQSPPGLRQSTSDARSPFFAPPGFAPSRGTATAAAPSPGQSAAVSDAAHADMRGSHRARGCRSRQSEQRYQPAEVRHVATLPAGTVVPVPFLHMLEVAACSAGTHGVTSSFCRAPYQVLIASDEPLLRDVWLRQPPAMANIVLRN